jgi:hypothetical protein
MGRQDSGRVDPNLRKEVTNLLDEARRHWTAEVNIRHLRRELLEILQRLEKG